MIQSIAETAWHHEGDFEFMCHLVNSICKNTKADIIKLHITLDIDEYMSQDHPSYKLLKKWMLNQTQWKSLIEIIKHNNKQVMLLLNDTKAIKFAAQFHPEFVELHSVCLNVPRLQKSILKNIPISTKIVIGTGGCTLEEIDSALNAFDTRECILMFGFQNYPTKYEDINLNKIRKIQSLYPDKTFGYADHTAWNEDNNEIITLLVAANNMSYIEKHITTKYGQERCDYNAAISIDMFNKLTKRLEVLESVRGNGTIKLNSGEKKYSQYGYMKMAATLKVDVQEGDLLSENIFEFKRTKEESDLSQLNILEAIGKKINRTISAGHVLQKRDLI